MSAPRDRDLSRLRGLPDAPDETGPDPEEVPAPAAARIADEQLVHALLACELGEARQAAERSIQAVLAAIDKPGADSARGDRQLLWRRALRRTAVAAAAGVLLAVGLFLLVSSRQPAHAAVDRILAAFDDGGDRTYRILVEEQDAPLPDQPRRGRHWAERQAWRRLLDGRAKGGRAELNGAILYLRGGRQFVLIRPAPNSLAVINGYDGRQSWLLRPKRPVLVSSDPRAFRIPMPQEMAAVPFVDLRETLHRIRQEYEIADASLRSLPNGGPRLRHVLAGNKAEDRRLPESVELWADPETGLLHRVVFHGAKTRGRPQPQRITLDLLSTDSLPDGWFTHGAHHDAEAEVQHRR